MNAAQAAAMSGPDLNPHFRRRWEEPDSLVVPRPEPRNERPGDDLDGLALLLAWRRDRSHRGEDGR